MLKIYTEIEINASAETIWNVLTNFSEYPTWNPYIRSISHLARPNESFNMSVIMPNGQQSDVTPVMEIVEPYKRLQWCGRIKHDLLFVGHHEFLIQELTAEKCLFIHQETFSGILLPLLKKRVNNFDGFEQMNLAIKQQVESINI